MKSDIIDKPGKFWWCNRFIELFNNIDHSTDKIKRRTGSLESFPMVYQNLVF